MSYTQLLRLVSRTAPTLADCAKALATCSDPDVLAQLASRPEVPAGVAVDAATNLVATGSDDAMNWLADRSGLLPAVQRRVAEANGLALVTFAEHVTDPEAVARIAERALSGPLPGNVWQMRSTVAEPHPSAATLHALHALVARADLAGSLAGVGARLVQAHQMAVRLDHRAFLETVLREWGKLHHSLCDRLVLDSGSSRLLAAYVHQGTVSAEVAQGVVDLVVARWLPGAEPDVDLLRALESVWPVLDARARGQVVGATANVDLTRVPYHARWLTAAVARLDNPAVRTVGFWRHAPASEVLAASEAVGYQLTPRAAAAFVSRSDVPTGPAIQVMRRCAVDAGTWLTCRSDDPEFVAELLDLHPEVFEATLDPRLLVAATAALLGGCAGQLLDACQLLRERRVLARLGDAVWALPWGGLLAWADHDPHVAGLVTERLYPLLTDPSQAAVVGVLLDSAAAPGEEAERLLDAIAAALHGSAEPAV